MGFPREASLRGLASDESAEFSFGLIWLLLRRGVCRKQLASLGAL